MIPTYRPKEAFLRKALESVLQQDPGEDQMQIEVVDDCSPDGNVEEMVGSIAGTRVSVSRTPSNLGLAGSWNTCIERARGQWVHILHHDDYVLPGFYEKLRCVAEQHPEVAMIASRSFSVNEQGVILGMSPRVPELEKGGRSAESFFYSNPIQCPGVVMRRKFYEKHGGFRSDLLFVLDVEMWARAVCQAGGMIIPEVLACFRLSNQQATSGLERCGKTLQDVERLIEIYEERYPSFNRRRSLRQLCEKALDQARRFSKAGDSDAAKASWDFWKHHLPLTLRLQAVASRLAYSVARRLAFFQGNTDARP